MMPEIALDLVDEVDSTSDALKRRAETTPIGEFALLARRQTGGRGRLGRRWETIDGNLHLSVLLRPGPMRRPGHWSLLAGVALAQAAAACLPDASGLRLKWPNDLVLNGAKLAGILAEAGDAGAPWLVLGFGVNLAGAPDGLGRATACLADHAPPPAPEAFARRLLAIVQGWRLRYAADGFDPVRAAWLERAPPLGEALSVTSGSEVMKGRFAGLSSTGGLLLETAAGLVTIVSGELA